MESLNQPSIPQTSIPKSIALPPIQSNNQTVSQPMQQGVPSSPQGQTIELKGIHLPEQVSNFPIAPGWWLITLLLITAVIFTVVKYFAHLRKCKDKNKALKQLQKNPNSSIGEGIAILKWSAMQYFPRQQVAKLYGKDLQTFLTLCLPEKKQATFDDLSSVAFSHLYQKDNANIVDQKLNQAIRFWLNNALPPQMIKQKQVNPMNQAQTSGVKQ